MQQSTFIACKRFAHRTGAALVATFGIAGAAFAADDVALASTTQSLPIVTATQAGGQLQSVDGFGVAVANEALERFRGGDVTTDRGGRYPRRGRRQFREPDRQRRQRVRRRCLRQRRGHHTVIQNSGSNVLIQNGMIVNVQFRIRRNETSLRSASPSRPVSPDRAAPPRWTCARRQRQLYGPRDQPQGGALQTTVPQRYDFSCGSAATATLLTYQYGCRSTRSRSLHRNVHQRRPGQDPRGRLLAAGHAALSAVAGLRGRRIRVAAG